MANGQKERSSAVHLPTALAADSTVPPTAPPPHEQPRLLFFGVFLLLYRYTRRANPNPGGGTKNPNANCRTSVKHAVTAMELRNPWHKARRGWGWGSGKEREDAKLPHQEAFEEPVKPDPAFFDLKIRFKTWSQHQHRRRTAMSV